MENHLQLVREGRTITHHIGWQDFNDTTTQTTPINLTTAGVYYHLTNDGLGTYSTQEYRIPDHTYIFNTSTNYFDFSSLHVGDTVDIRVDLSIDNNSSNTEYLLNMDFAVGGLYPYSLLANRTYLKTNAVHHVVSSFSFYIGNEMTRDYPAKLSLSSDSNSNVVTVNGWFVRTIARK